MIGTRSYEAYEQAGFASEWTVSGDEAGRTVTLPLVETRAEGALAYDCTVNWGDGTTSAITAFDDADRVHIYSEAGTYLIEITGTCEGWSFNNGGDKLKIRRIINWGGDDFDGWKYLNSGFYGCSNLVSLGDTTIKPSGTGIGTDGFAFTFNGCDSLTSIPTDLFRYNTAVSTVGFYQTFYGCSSLTSIPTDLFRYNTAVSTEGFYQTFYGCIKLQLNANIFYADGEETTRFLNRVSDFTLCFSRTSFTGTQGTAPTLWDCDFGTETPTTTDCFDGAGNSATSLTNYADIPEAWK